MKKLVLFGLVATLVAACDHHGAGGHDHSFLNDENLSVAEKIAMATCGTEGDAVRRDKWLGESKPSWDDYVESHKANTDDPVENSSVAMAYKAYLDSGMSHEAANALFSKTHKKWDMQYPRFAKCWVQYE